MGLEGLGYVGIRAKNLDDWSTYATRFLGMQLVDKLLAARRKKGNSSRCGDKPDCRCRFRSRMTCSTRGAMSIGTT